MQKLFLLISAPKQIKDLLVMSKLRSEEKVLEQTKICQCLQLRLFYFVMVAALLVFRLKKHTLSWRQAELSLATEGPCYHAYRLHAIRRWACTMMLNWLWLIDPLFNGDKDLLSTERQQLLLRVDAVFSVRMLLKMLVTEVNELWAL